ncbi:hypothetical protein PR248_02530 [Metamycoplasma hyosynoviae]|nr:hypothetical protein [Metamycoplasma hyosynoviae]MDC8913907.1 hypothetical protein [Metamycoplasma hyosynoviae]
MKTKHKKLFFIGLTFLVSSCLLLSSIGINKLVRKKKINKEDKNNQHKKVVTIKIKGAVFYPGEYIVKHGSKFFNLLPRIKLKPNADITKIDNNLILEKDLTIFIPFSSKAKMKLKDIKKVDDLINIGIKKSIATKLFNLIKTRNWNIRWEDIEKVSGIGVKTMQILKEKIQL